MSLHQEMDNASRLSGTSEERPVDAPPYIPECEVFEIGGSEGAEYKFDNCVRCCGEDFTPVKEFTKDHLPEWHRNDKHAWQDFEQLRVRTVKLVVSYTSKDRPDTHPDSTAPYPYAEYRESDRVTRTGTGFVLCKEPLPVKHTKCPCPKCQKPEEAKKEYFRVFVVTAAHVVFDDLEAQNTVCELFDDEPRNKDSVKLLYGVKGADKKSISREQVNWKVNNLYKRNNMGNVEKRTGHMFIMECVSHDMELYKVLEPFLKDREFYEFDHTPCIVSHPHGHSKMVGIRGYGELRIQLGKTHTHDTRYRHRHTIPENSQICTEIDPTIRYSNFFKKDPSFAGYLTKEPLDLYLPVDESNTITCKLNQGSYGDYFLPEGSRLCSLNEGTDIQCGRLCFYVYKLFNILKDKDCLHHFVYDTNTCKGSSGAWVPMHGCTDLDTHSHCHFGKMDGNGGLNRTGWWKTKLNEQS